MTIAITLTTLFALFTAVYMAAGYVLPTPEEVDAFMVDYYPELHAKHQETK